MKPEIIHLLVFAIIFVAIGLLFSLLLGRKSEKTVKYDERQLLAQGKAYKAGFFSLMSLLCVYIVYNAFSENMILRAPEGIFLCICASILVFAVICIANDAYVALNENNRMRTAVLGFLGVSNLLLGIERIINGTIVEDGAIGIHVINLAVGVMSVVIVAALIIRSAQQKKTAALEESDDE